MQDNLTLNVRGLDAYGRKAPTGIRVVAALTDLSLGLATLALATQGLRELLGWPAAASTLAGAGALAALWAAQRALAGQTPGQIAWKLKPSPTGVLQPNARTAFSVFFAIFLTFAGFAAAGWLELRSLDSDPLWLEAEGVVLDPFIPDAASAGDWAIEPWFYSLGAWPRVFHGKPVFHVIRYEKGPPKRFPGHIAARWEMPETELVFEGPKTPEGVGRGKLERCLATRELSPSCWSLRRSTIARHESEATASLRAAAAAAGGESREPIRWRLRWLLVRNPAIPAEEQAQGFELSASLGARSQSRFVLVTARGTEQSFILDAPAGAPGDDARAALDKAIRSLRASDSLDPGRAWVDREIENVRLDELKLDADSPSPELGRLAAVQALLLSKISVDPSTYDSYFHLGGISWLLARHALRNPQSGMGAIARPLVQSAYFFARDIAPDDPRTQQLQGFWLEAQKF